MNLEEKEYFSFKFHDADLQYVWLDLSKSIHSQFKSIYIENNEIVIYFHVKHYITDPCKLTSELTRFFFIFFDCDLSHFDSIQLSQPKKIRYLYYLQLRKDILQGRLTVQFDYAVDLFSYFLQGFFF